MKAAAGSQRKHARLVRAVAEHPVEASLWAAAVFLRFFLLGAKSLWLDESMTLAIARQPWAEVVPLVRANELLPPLHYLLMRAWTACFSDPLLGMRAFSALCGLATLAVFRRICGELLPRRALLAFAVAAFSSYWIDASQSGRPYALFLLLAAVQFDLFLNVRERWTPRAGAAYAAVGALGLYTHYYFGLVLLAQLADAAWTRRRRLRELAPWLACAAFWAAAFAPWITSLLGQLSIYAGKPTLSEPFGAAALLRLAGGMFMNLSVLSFAAGPWPAAAGAAALTLFAAAPLLRSRLDAREKEALRLLAVQLILPLAAAKTVELALGRPATQARYFVFLSVPAYALAALLLGALRGWARQAANALLGLALAAGVAGYFYSALDLDSRLAAMSAVLRRSAGHGAAVVHLNPYYYTSLRYYYLPELPHFLLDESSPMLNWKALPGYAPVLPRQALLRLPRALVVDPERALFPRRVGVATGAQLDAWRRGAPLPR